MERAGLDRLTQAQKAALRLVLQGLEVKEIARALKTSSVAVTERLRAARATLGVSRSIDAARLLARHEAINISYVDTPNGVAGTVSAHPEIVVPDQQATGVAEAAPTEVRDARTVYEPMSIAFDPARLTFGPDYGGARNELSRQARLRGILEAAVMIALVVCLGFLLLVLVSLRMR